MKELLESIKALSLVEKETLYRELRTMISDERKVDVTSTLMEHYKDRICSIMGLETYEPTSRERVQVIARTIIANVLMSLGYSANRIGEVMRKDHSTILYYKTIFEDWLEFPHHYDEELKYWNKTIKGLCI